MEHVQSAEEQARDIEPILRQAGWTLSLGAIAAVIDVIEAKDTRMKDAAHFLRCSLDRIPVDLTTDYLRGCITEWLKSAPAE